jgi:cytoskeletal protein CcmA (bactofilin family)
MFSNKPVKSTAHSPHSAEAPAPNRKPMAASLIAGNVTIKGDVVTEGDVQLDGVVQGDLRVGHLTIGETGEVKGAIEAQVVDLRGHVTGSIRARQVKLFGTAHMDGDITHTELAIDAGARFQGRSIRDEPAAAELSLVTSAAE